MHEGVKLAHVDIAGPSNYSKPHSVYASGCTGFGVGTILEHYRSNFAK